MKLPNFHKAIVPIEKLRDYCLNPDHPRGKHKEAVFRSELGLDKKDAHKLKFIIEEGIKSVEVKETFKDEYGVRYSGDVAYNYKDKQVIIRTLWIVKSNQDFPSLITCYIKRKK